MRPMMLISVMVSAPYSSLSAAKRFSLESPEDTHRARQAADYRGGKPPEALHSARVHKHTHTQRESHIHTLIQANTYTYMLYQDSVTDTPQKWGYTFALILSTMCTYIMHQIQHTHHVLAFISQTHTVRFNNRDAQ